MLAHYLKRVDERDDPNSALYVPGVGVFSYSQEEIDCGLFNPDLRYQEFMEGLIEGFRKSPNPQIEGWEYFGEVDLPRKMIEEIVSWDGARKKIEEGISLRIRELGNKAFEEYCSSIQNSLTQF